MEIIHIVFARNSKAKTNVIIDIVNQLASEQVKIGYKVEVWEIGARPLDQLQQKPFLTKSFKSSLFMWNTMKNLKKFIDALDEHKIVHIHGGIIPIFYPIIFNLHQKNIPFVLSPHGRYNLYTLNDTSFLKRKHFQNFDTNIIQWAKAIHFCSEFERKELSEYYPFDIQKSYIIPNGLINNNLNIAPKIMKHDEVIYCFYGDLSMAEMGIDILLSGFSKFKKSHQSNAILWIIGNGKDRNNILKSIKKLGLHKYVFLKPAVYGALKFEQLSKIDIMVRTARVDYAPMVVLEAAAMSIPSIVSDATYLSNLIQQNNAGYTLKHNHSDELKSILVESMNDLDSVQWNRKKLNAHQMVVDNCSWNKIAREHIDVYKELNY